MENMVFWGIPAWFGVLFSVFAVDVLSDVDERAKLPSWMSQAAEFIFTKLSHLQLLLLYVVNAFVFGMLEGLIILIFQALAGALVACIVAIAVIILLQIEDGAMKMRELVAVFYKKQFRML